MRVHLVSIRTAKIEPRLSPESTLSATLQTDPFHFRITVCLRRVILNATTCNKLNLKTKRKKSAFKKRDYWNHSLLPLLPFLLQLMKFHNTCHTSLYLTLPLECLPFITPHYNCMMGITALILWMRPAQISSVKPLYLSTSWLPPPPS